MTELIDNPPPLPEPAKKEPWQTAANGKWSSGVNVFYTAYQYRAGEAAAFARGVAAGRNAGLEAKPTTPCAHKNSECIYESDDGEFERWKCRDCGFRWGKEIAQ